MACVNYIKGTDMFLFVSIAGSFLLIYVNEYHVPVSSFTFHADQNAIRVWVDYIRKAQVSLFTVHHLYNTPPYTKDLYVTLSCCSFQFFSLKILHKSYRKMTMKRCPLTPLYFFFQNRIHL